MSRLLAHTPDRRGEVRWQPVARSLFVVTRLPGRMIGLLWEQDLHVKGAKAVMSVVGDSSVRARKGEYLDWERETRDPEMGVESCGRR